MKARSFFVSLSPAVQAVVVLVLLCGYSLAGSVERPGASLDAEFTLAVDSGNFIFTGSEGARTRPVTIWYHRPLEWKRSDPIVLVMHGGSRNARSYLAAWIRHAEHYRFLLVVPEFSRAQYPRSRQYQQGNVLTQNGTLIDSAQWSFTTVEKIFDEVKKRTGSARNSYRIYGHSGGSQFVHRMLLLMPKARIERAVVANAGYYTIPTLEVIYPYGLGGVLDEAKVQGWLQVAFGREVTVLLGTEDTETTHSGLRRTREAMVQGAHRFERGNAFFEAAERQAKRLDVPFMWRILPVPGVGHSNRRMAPAAAKILMMK